MTELEQILTDTIKQQNIQIAKQSEQISELSQQIKNLNEQIAYMNRKRFGVSSEQNVPGQTDLFGNPFEESETTELEQTVVVPSHRRKVRGYKEAQLAGLPTEEVHYELSKKERFCDVCDTYMTELGQKKVRSTVKYIPAKLVEQQHIQHSCECPHCKLNSEKASVKSARVPKPLFHSSFVSAELLATVFSNKFELSLPLYRQVPAWKRLGLELTDRTMTNWIIQGANKWLSPIYSALHDALMRDDVIHIDETPTQTLHRSDGKAATAQSRLWVMHSSKDSSKQISYYHASLSRSHEVADRLLRDYNGIIQSDGYAVYQGLHEGIMNVNCWAHVRRKFVESAKDAKNGQAHLAIKLIDRLFMIERTVSNSTPEERIATRLTESKPVLDEFWAWIENTHALAKTKLGIAIEYTAKLRDGLMAFLTDGRIMISNNLAERSVRPVTVGRKNWLFSTSEAGATANAIAHTVVRTAIENGLDAQKYLTYLFTHLPETELSNKSALAAFLPWADEVQQTCR